MDSLTQSEADDLMRLAKKAADNETYSFPSFGGSVSIPISSMDEREDFLLDLHQASVSLKKFKYQARARRFYILARLDWGGAPHRNPNDEEISCPHIHIYKEGFGDKWAYAAPSEIANAVGKHEILDKFMAYCNIVVVPSIVFGLQ